MPSTAARTRGRGGARGRAGTAQHTHIPSSVVVNNPSFGGAAKPYSAPGDNAEQYGTSSATMYSTPIEGEHQGNGIAETSTDESK